MGTNTAAALLAAAAATAASIGFSVPVEWLVGANLTVTLATFSLLVDHRGRISSVEAKHSMLIEYHIDDTDTEEQNA